MHKHIATAALSILSASAMAEGNLNVGVIGGWDMGQAKESLSITSNIPTSARYKYTNNGNGPVAGITAGYAIHKEKNMYGVSLAAYKDFFSVTNAGPKKDSLGSLNANFKTSVKRKNTYELSGKIGRMMMHDTCLYGKIGVLRSNFVEHYSESGVAKLKKNFAAWGGVLGLGVQKRYNAVNVGLEYNYQYYEKTGTKILYSTGGDNYTNNSKLHPQYHSVLFTISKSI